MPESNLDLGLEILLVDDEPFTRGLLHRLLTKLGYADIEQAEDAESALQLLKAHAFDLIITDIQLPGMNGLEFVRNIRAGLTSALRDTRVIIVTSFSNHEVLGGAMALDVNGFLVKPMKPAMVQEKISLAMKEELPLQAAKSYGAVKTGLKTIGSAEAPPAPEPRVLPERMAPREVSAPVATRPQPGAPRSGRRVNSMELTPGMRLAEDVVSDEGILVLKKGFVLAPININRLFEMRHVLDGEGAFWIDEEPV